MLTPARVELPVIEETVVGASSAVSWPAILAGGAAAAAISIVLLAFGAGVGFSAVSPWSDVASTTAFRVSTGLYFIVMAMLASSVGGYLAYQHGIYADLSVTGKGVRIRYPQGVSSLADTTLHLQGAQNSLQLSGNVLVTRFSVSPDGCPQRVDVRWPAG